MPPNTSQPPQRDEDHRMVTRTFSVKIPASWTAADVQTAIDMWILFFPGRRPSQVSEEERNASVESALATSQPAHGEFEEIPPNLTEDLYHLAKRTYLRYFKIEAPNTLIEQVYGKNLKLKNLRGFLTIKKRMMALMVSIKSNTLLKFYAHVKEALEKGGEAIRKCRDDATIRQFFAGVFTMKDVMGIFSWADSIIDIERSRNRVKNFMYGIYTNMCTKIKHHLDDPLCPKYDRHAVLAFWDSIGQEKAWDNIDLSHFALRPRDLKRKRIMPSGGAGKGRKKNKLGDHVEWELPNVEEGKEGEKVVETKVKKEVNDG
ncbi:hypothetical protein P167DRAFT_579917 [Morchella conica CCBAS932]|uniref:Uncharacterized protein n=1 Tax=Morchella conica CCBAS932 TaxID=1392247 RepID=A0A3N4K8W8_9PEZI|nr:hypothetical protein P167DRAFT_579917 [Morchella conica CCBAS932]